MKTSNDLLHIVIHLIGGSVFLAALVSLLLLTLPGHSTYQDDIVDLRSSIQNGLDEYKMLSRQRDFLEVRLSNLRIQLKDLSTLSRNLPMTEYMNQLSHSALNHGLKVTSHAPLPPRTYSGLLERPFTFELTGNYVNLLRFLMEVESMDAWADISHLKIDTPRARARVNHNNRSALLTFSLFSSMMKPTHDLKEPG